MRGETLPVEQQVYHVKVVRMFLRTAVSLNKIQLFRGLLEENAYRLTETLPDRSCTIHSEGRATINQKGNSWKKCGSHIRWNYSFG